MQPRMPLEETVRQVRELIAKQRLVEGLVHSREGKRKELVEAITHRQQLVKLQIRLRQLHIGDLADLLESLPLDERELVWEQVRRARGGELLVEVSEAVRDHLLQITPPEELPQLIDQLDADDLAFLAEELPQELVAERLSTLSATDQDWYHSTVTYPEDSVGNLMTHEMVVVRTRMNLKNARRLMRRRGKLPASTDKVFVIDERGLFRGVLTLEGLLMGEPETSVEEVMATQVVSFAPEEDAGHAARAFERYDLVSAPVINQRGKLVGRLTVDVMLDYIRQESHEDTLNIAGVKREEDLFSPVMASARNRWLWLFLNLMTAFVASRVIGAFEDTISHLVALAALVPIVGSIAGNTGNQTTALVIRGLALNRITPENRGFLARKEFLISVLNGAVWGSVVGLFAMVFYHDIHLAAVITAAMFVNLIIAAMVGVAIPLGLQRLGRDPAMGAAVLVTATTDSIGFAIFLGLAAWLLV